MPQASATDSLISYPCDFPIKVMGASSDAFLPAIAQLVADMVPGFDPASIEVRASSGGRYQGLTVSVRVHSRAQLDAIYQALHDHHMVALVL